MCGGGSQEGAPQPLSAALPPPCDWMRMRCARAGACGSRRRSRGASPSRSCTCGPTTTWPAWCARSATTSAAWRPSSPETRTAQRCAAAARGPSASHTPSRPRPLTRGPSYAPAWPRSHPLSPPPRRAAARCRAGECCEGRCAAAMLVCTCPQGRVVEVLHLATLSAVLACLMRHFRASLASLPLLAQPLSALPLGTWAPDAPAALQQQHGDDAPATAAPGDGKDAARRQRRRVTPLHTVTPATPLTQASGSAARRACSSPPAPVRPLAACKFAPTWRGGGLHRVRALRACACGRLQALGLLLEGGVSALPVVDEQRRLVDVYARGDITALARGNAYNRLQWEDVTVSAPRLRGAREATVGGPARVALGASCATGTPLPSRAGLDWCPGRHPTKRVRSNTRAHGVAAAWISLLPLTPALGLCRARTARRWARHCRWHPSAARSSSRATARGAPAAAAAATAPRWRSTRPWAASAPSCTRRRSGSSSSGQRRQRAPPARRRRQKARCTRGLGRAAPARACTRAPRTTPCARWVASSFFGRVAHAQRLQK